MLRTGLNAFAGHFVCSRDWATETKAGKRFAAAVTRNGKAGISLPRSGVARITGERAEVVIKVPVYKSQCIQIAVGRLLVRKAISIGLRKLKARALPPASPNHRRRSRVTEP